MEQRAPPRVTECKLIRDALVTIDAPRAAEAKNGASCHACLNAILTERRAQAKAARLPLSAA